MENIYYIVNKITWDTQENKIKFEEVGYTTKIEDYEFLQNNYNTTLGSYIENNKTELENGTKTLAEFFNTTAILYVCFTTTTCIEGFGFIEEINIIYY
jgi:hypothetical protein